MQSLEDRYEKTLLLKLPPKARDVAEVLLKTKSLADLLSMWQENRIDACLLDEFQVTSEHCYAILNATILAKTTCFLANPNFTQKELLYLIKAASASAGLSLKKHDLKEVIQLSRTEFPVLHEWLLDFSQRLKAPD